MAKFGSLVFQNLRSTRQTELTELFPLHIVCSSLGNSERAAKGHYVQMTQKHFDRSAGLSVGQRGNQKANPPDEDQTEMAAAELEAVK